MSKPKSIHDRWVAIETRRVDLQSWLSLASFAYTRGVSRDEFLVVQKVSDKAIARWAWNAIVSKRF